jgi:hypothetical protein
MRRGIVGKYRAEFVFLVDAQVLYFFGTSGTDLLLLLQILYSGIRWG